MPTLRRELRALSAALLAALSAPAAISQTTNPSELYRLVKRFDFDERGQGNYEDEPMHWSRLEGPGLPGYNRGWLDDRRGHDGPPSFRLDVQSANVAYEYRHLDLTIVPGSDYVVRGMICAQGLIHSRAFLAAYLVDRFGDRIVGSDRVSNLVRSVRSPLTSSDVGPPRRDVAADDATEPWQPVELTIPGEYPSAFALRLQCWVLQGSVWQSPGPGAVDPIVRRDVRATAWFDDIGVFRLPRARLRLSNPAGVVLPDRDESLIVEVQNATAQQMWAEVAISDAAGRIISLLDHEVPTLTAADWTMQRRRDARTDGSLGREMLAGAVRSPVPPLTPGIYTARMRLRNAHERLLERELRFAALAPLPPAAVRRPEVGVDLGCWRGGDIEGIVEALAELGCGSAKIGVMAGGESSGGGESESLTLIGELIRELGTRRIEAVGVILPPDRAPDSSAPPTIRRMIMGDPSWRARMSPAFAQLGGLMTTWQLGDEQAELHGDGAWDDGLVSLVRDHLRRFVTVPELVASVSASAASGPAAATHSILVPELVPARDVPRALERYASSTTPAWVKLDTREDTRGPAARRTDVARRFVLAKAVGVSRVYVDAPVRRIAQAGATLWEPTEEYLVLRTLMRHLAGKRLVASMSPEPDTTALVFRGTDSCCMVIWSWCESDGGQPVYLYLGPSPQAIDLLGRPVPIERRGEQARLMIGPEPIIVEGLHTALALLQASFRVAPTFLQAHNHDTKPILTFRNPYWNTLSGEATFHVPAGWEVLPRVIPFELAPGQTLEQALDVVLPPRELASGYDLGVRLRLRAPEEAELTFTQRLDVGLRDILVEARARWEGTTLIVEQSIRNLSTDRIRFSGFCETPRRARAEALFLDIPHGESQTALYVYPDSRDLAGAQVHVGVREIRGLRRLDQLVEVPKD